MTETPPDAPQQASQDDAPATAGSGLRSVVGDDFDLAASIGGWRGILEGALPTVLFVAIFTVSGSIPWAGGVAVAAVIVFIVARLIARAPISQAVGGLIAVGIGAIWAVRSDRGSDFYAPGLVYNAVYATGVLVTILVRHPLVGLVVALLDPDARDWREDADARRTYRNATWVLFSLFALKVLVQLPLWLADATTALGVAKIVMGLPLFALTLFVIWSMHRALGARRAARSPRDGESDPATGP